ncbi:uncharacterized protein LOC107364322 [Tetranychus urticae]|uniref:BEN domain-containing protein n=1 Tax=Tetranychus urticae TaxID=32264 RepID=T1KH23_TETUR|nr:uncharacterized protein LOC107364322 [Tetranychus urticae]XP_015787146.1 uncharacterized protein LOC107364322 [Tetranychus urticae]
MYISGSQDSYISSLVVKMTKIVPHISDCDFTVEINDAHVIVQDKDGNSDPWIMSAIFFAKNRVDISAKITNCVDIKNPNGDSTIVNILFYSTLDLCKEKLRRISSGPLILENSRRKGNRSGHDTPIASTSQQSRNCDSYPLDSNEVTSNLNILKRCVDNLANKIDTLMKNLIERLNHIDDKLDSNSFSSSIRDPSLNITDHAMSEIAACRNDSKWRRRVKAMVWPQLDDIQNEACRKELLKGNKSASKTVISLARIIYGDKLKTHLLGEKGRLIRAPREGERSEVISAEDEEILREILSLFGNDLFNDPTNWEVLVRGPVNQCGRESKRNSNKVNSNSKRDLLEANVTQLESSTQMVTEPAKKKQKLDSEVNDEEFEDQLTE